MEKKLVGNDQENAVEKAGKFITETENEFQKETEKEMEQAAIRAVKQIIERIKEYYGIED